MLCRISEITFDEGKCLVHRIGIIGLGKIASDRHLPTILAHPAFELTAVADVAADLTKLPVAGFPSHMEMLSAMQGLEAVAICTPPRARFRVALDALEAGKHVLLEKPPTATVGEMMVLQHAAKRAGRVLFTAWHSQHNEAVDQARLRLAGQTIERLEIMWKEDVHKWHPGQEWIWRTGGFGVFDPGINALSVLTRILPAPACVRDAELLVPRDADMPIAANITFDIGGGEGNGHAEFDWRSEAGELREITVTTGGGTIMRLAASGGRLLVDGHVVVDGPRAEYPRMYSHFDALIQAGESDVDIAPLVLAIDALSLGRRVALPMSVGASGIAG